MTIWSRLQALEASSAELDGELRVCRAEHGQMRAMTQVFQAESERERAKLAVATWELKEVKAERDERFSARSVIFIGSGALLIGVIGTLLLVAD